MLDIGEKAGDERRIPEICGGDPPSRMESRRLIRSEWPANQPIDFLRIADQGTLTISVLKDYQ
jgi:hypothetical protein